MAFIFSREKTLVSQKKFQQYLIFALLAVVLVTAFILWKGFSKGSSPSLPYANPRVSQVQKVELDFGVLQGKIFDELGSPPSPVSLPQQSGRSNPFISF